MSSGKSSAHTPRPSHLIGSRVILEAHRCPLTDLLVVPLAGSGSNGFVPRTIARLSAAVCGDVGGEDFQGALHESNGTVGQATSTTTCYLTCPAIKPLRLR